MTLPTSVNEQFVTLIDNLFKNFQNYKCISGSLTACISDHLSNFIKTENILGNDFVKSNDSIAYKDYKNFNINSFKTDIDAVD